MLFSTNRKNPIAWLDRDAGEDGEAAQHLVMPSPGLARHRPRRLIEAHRDIIDALKTRSVGQAELWMRLHMVHFRRGHELCNFALKDAIAFEGAGRCSTQSD